MKYRNERFLHGFRQLKIYRKRIKVSIISKGQSYKTQNTVISQKNGRSCTQLNWYMIRKALVCVRNTLVYHYKHK